MDVDLSDEEFVLPEQHVNLALTLPKSETLNVASVSGLASDKGKNDSVDMTRYFECVSALTGSLVCRTWNSPP